MLTKRFNHGHCLLATFQNGTWTKPHSQAYAKEWEEIKIRQHATNNHNRMWAHSIMTLNVKVVIFNKLETPYVGRTYYMEIGGGHYMVLVYEDPSCTCLNWTFVKLTKQGHKFSPCKHLYWIFNTYFSSKDQYFTHQATLFVKEIVQMLLANDPNPPLDLLTCYTTLEWSREEKYM